MVATHKIFGASCRSIVIWFCFLQPLHQMAQLPIWPMSRGGS